MSAVKPLDADFAAQEFGTVGLLETWIVMRTRLYGQLNRTRAIALEEEIETLRQACLEMAVAGNCTDTVRALFLNAGHRMVADFGVNAIVFAETDLNLAFDGQESGYKVVYAPDIHVDVLARLVCDKTTLEEVGWTDEQTKRQPR